MIRLSTTTKRRSASATSSASFAKPHTQDNGDEPLVRHPVRRLWSRSRTDRRKNASACWSHYALDVLGFGASTPFSTRTLRKSPRKSRRMPVELGSEGSTRNCFVSSSQRMRQRLCCLHSSRNLLALMSLPRRRRKARSHPLHPSLNRPRGRKNRPLLQRYQHLHQHPSYQTSLRGEPCHAQSVTLMITPSLVSTAC
jgi:hypothetical protein